ncbi:unnamed protein product [Prorocentrum cordatum]|uniref:Cathepsin propeptide inhibitor domain-containing protein n=1 Tax=Prorocentrum cordatum TaxID=2364126 RepID=A0ABN9VUV3_9DINO|nr:unnamed protein product [Polarella glacialis]
MDLGLIAAAVLTAVGASAAAMMTDPKLSAWELWEAYSEDRFGSFVEEMRQERLDRERKESRRPRGGPPRASRRMPRPPRCDAVFRPRPQRRPAGSPPPALRPDWPGAGASWRGGRRRGGCRRSRLSRRYAADCHAPAAAARPRPRLAR